MQKWIRDRVRRRKSKPTEQNAATEVTPPLQPAYPDDIADSTVAAEAEPKPEATVEDNVPADEEATAPERVRPKRRRKKKAAKAAATPPEEQAPEAAPSEVGGDEGATPPVPSAEVAAEPTVEHVSDVEETAPAEEVEAPSEQPTAEASVPVQTPPAPKVRKGSKGAVVLAVGLPGSGKSTWFKRHAVTPLSSDMVRHLLFDNPTEQRYQDLVFGTLRSLLRARLIARMPMNYVDATNLSPKERRHWIRMAKDFGYDAHAVYFDVPVEVCMDRNRRRNRVVPEDVMHRMNAKLRPPAFDEGFAKIIVVRVKPRAGSGERAVDVNPDEKP